MQGVQEKVLEIFKEIKKICEDNGLRYYAIGGTALGAVRHNGFIPWDDDLDIAMPLEDYNRFFEIAEQYLPTNLKIRFSREQKYSTIFFDKIQNIDTTFIEKIELSHPEIYKGVFVDIAPLVDIPNNKVLQKLFSVENKLLLKICENKYFPFSDCNTGRQRLYYVLTFVVSKTLSNNVLHRLWMFNVRKYGLFKSDYTGYAWIDFNESQIFKKTWFDSYIELPFEDTMMRLPIGYKEMLSNLFGNYMVLPAETDRISHSNGLIDLTHPFKYYIDKLIQE